MLVAQNKIWPCKFDVNREGVKFDGMVIGWP